jgi:transketolase
VTRFPNAIDKLCVNTIRTLSIDMVEKAKSGHPGLPLGAAPMAYTLWMKHLKFNPEDPSWIDRDRFVLSAGHGSAMLYSLLYLFGFGLTIDDLKNFRQMGSPAAGHPEFMLAPGIEATTGPLGQGASNAVGMAIAERKLANIFNRDGFEIFNHHTYAIVSDGDMMEGISSESASLAGHLKLGKLIMLYDSNDICLDGPTSKCFCTEDVAGRYKSYGWQVLEVKDGNTDLKAIDDSISAAKKETGKPSLIIIKTTIGYGSPNKAGKSKSHGAPLGTEETKLTKEQLGWEYTDDFHVPDKALNHFRTAIDSGSNKQEQWHEMLREYALKHNDLHCELKRVFERKLPDGWDKIPAFEPGDGMATRNSSSTVMNAIALKFPEMFGGAADLASSTLCYFDGEEDFDGVTGSGKNIRFGVREHAMGGIANGMAYHGGTIPVVSTFFIFTDYMRNPIRLASMMHLPVLYVMSHDSIAVGEDGPTHEPIEQLMSLRLIPHLRVFRPCDANETLEAWRFIMKNPDNPSMLVLTRQKVPTLNRKNYSAASLTHRGAYILSEPDSDPVHVILIATGSEVHIALEAQHELETMNIHARVVSMPCWELFERQTDEYKNSVLPAKIKARISIEAGSTLGWERWIGLDGIAIGIDRFGMSAPGEINMREFGFTAENIVKHTKKLLVKK